MHEIYHNASVVIIWLGPDPNCEALLVREFFRALLQKYYTDSDVYNSAIMKYKTDWLHLDNEEFSLASSGLPPLDASIWRSVVDFWERSWFSRAWVRSEAAVAQRIEIYCGDVDFTLDEIVETSRFHVWSGLGDTLMTLKKGVPEVSMSVTGRTVGCSAVGIEDLQMWAGGITYTEAEDQKLVADQLTGPRTEQKHPLLREFAVSLFLSRRDDASDARDKVLALLVLMRRMSASYEVDELPL